MDKINKIISSILNVPLNKITKIQLLKKGMTNQSYTFELDNQKYIFRLPGVGTDHLLNRKEEIASYQAIKGKGICTDIKYIDERGYKITHFIDNARVCNPQSPEDVTLCINALKKMHSYKFQVSHTFDIFYQIENYEKLWNSNHSKYRDYKNTKKNVLSLKQFISVPKENICLTHIDAVPDNFLITPEKKIELVDWEYAGMQDPHVDIAMFAIYSLYDRKELDRLIDLYFDNNCTNHTRSKIYCYVALGGLLWSNWCEYKEQLGVHFDNYALKQYEYAKNYYYVAMEYIKENV